MISNYILNGKYICAIVYNIDGNDKLKRWGFCIHDYVDGFSRKILRLNVASSNNNPLIIANYFLASIKRYKLLPQTLRMDRGTESIYCEDLQVYFTKNVESFVYASSTRNQRIECLWSRLKKFRLNWWINFFSEITKIRLFKPHLSSHQKCLLFFTDY